MIPGVDPTSVTWRSAVDWMRKRVAQLLLELATDLDPVETAKVRGQILEMTRLMDQAAAPAPGRDQNNEISSPDYNV